MEDWNFEELEIRGIPYAYANDGLNNKIEEWYEKFGFGGACDNRLKWMEKEDIYGWSSKWFYIIVD